MRLSFCSPTTALHLGCLGLLGIICYANSLSNGFVFDDSAYLSSPLVRHLAPLDIFSTNWLGLDIYRPLTLSSLALDFWLYQEDPFGYHLTNLLLHLSNGILLYFLAKELLDHRTAALLAALLYIAHPIQTEVVAWISARGDLLASFFVLAALSAHRRADSGGQSPFSWRLLAGLSFAAALLAKETAILLPAALFLCSFCFKKTAAPLFTFALGWFKRHWGYALAAGLALALRWLAFSDIAAPAAPISTNFLAELDLWSRLATTIAILPRYLVLLAVPRRLCADYSHASIPPVSSPFDLWFVAGLASLAALSLLPKATGARFITFTTLFFALSLVPVANLLFLAPSGMAERYLHLGMIPLALSFGWGSRQWLGANFSGPNRTKQFLPGLVALAVLLPLSLTTIQRNRDWHSDLTLFTAVLAHYPNNARAHSNLAFAHLQQSHYQPALHHYQRAAALDPTQLKNHFNLGVLYYRLQRYNKAIQAFKTTLSLNPNHIEGHFNLALAYQKTKNLPQAIGHYLAALDLDPQHRKSHYNLGRAYDDSNRLKAAAEQYQAFLGLEPNSIKAHYRLGEIYRRWGQYNQMTTAWTKVLHLDPKHRDADRIRQFLQGHKQHIPDTEPE